MTEKPDMVSAPGFPKVRAGLSAWSPFGWLNRALDDFKACPGPSIFYGACFAAMGAALNVAFARYYQYVSALVSGFMLLGPFLAIGLYDLSRRRERGQPCALRPTLGAWRGNVGNLGVFSLILIVVFLVWARASLVIFALFYTAEMPTLQGFLQQVLALRNAEFLAVYAAVGGVFALLVFAISVISVPLMLDRNQDAVTAMLASFLALARNFPAMLVWAASIVALVVVGFATLYAGLALTVPLLGHATWHAYRDLVESDFP
jgi:uncharacterized membrane protein